MPPRRAAGPGPCIQPPPPPGQVLTDSGGGGGRIRSGCSRPPVYATSFPRIFSASVPKTECQSGSRGELRGVLPALLHRRPGERLFVVMDS